MDKQVLNSIQKFENKKEFFEVKLKTRQSFREDQEALERRLSKYRLDDVNGGVKEGAKTTNTESVSTRERAANVNGSEHSKLESIVMDIEKEHELERTRTLSETEADKEDSEIKVPDDLVEVDNDVDKTDKQCANTESASVKQESERTSVKQNGITESDQTGVNSETVETVKANGHAVLNGSVSLNTPSTFGDSAKTLTNGHAKGSVTPEPRLKLRGTRLYEKNSKLTASSSDHLDKISLKGGLSRIGHGHTAGSHTRKPVEQQILVPIVAGKQVASLPKDGNLKDFSVEEMVSVFRMLRLPENLIYRLATNKIDGKRFAMFTDKDLDTLGLRNPVMRYFRDRSSTRGRVKKNGFML